MEKSPLHPSENPDPTNSSLFVNPKLRNELTRAPRSRTRDPNNHKLAPVMVEAGGEHFVELHHSFETHQAVARILKGIIPVADVVQVPDKHMWGKLGYTRHFSYALPTEAISEPTSVEDAKADLLILKTIFGDDDHGESYRDPKSGKTNSPTNMVRTSDDKVYFYDLGYAQAYMLRKEVDERRLKEEIATMNDHAKELFLTKLDQLEGQISGEQGLVFLHAVFGPSAKHLDDVFYFLKTDKSESSNSEGLVEQFQTALVHRILQVKKIVQSD